MKLSVVNSSNETVYEKEVSMVNPPTIRLDFDLPDLPPGNYYAQISVDGEIVSMFPLRIQKESDNERT